MLGGAAGVAAGRTGRRGSFVALAGNDAPGRREDRARRPRARSSRSPSPRWRRSSPDLLPALQASRAAVGRLAARGRAPGRTGRQPAHAQRPRRRGGRARAGAADRRRAAPADAVGHAGRRSRVQRRAHRHGAPSACRAPPIGRRTRSGRSTRGSSNASAPCPASNRRRSRPGVLQPLLANSATFSFEGKPLPPPEQRLEYPDRVRLAGVLRDHRRRASRAGRIVHRAGPRPRAAGRRSSTRRSPAAVWPGEDPIGRRLQAGDGTDQRPWMTVVGVVKDLRRARRQAADPRRDLCLHAADDAADADAGGPHVGRSVCGDAGDPARAAGASIRSCRCSG